MCGKVELQTLKTVIQVNGQDIHEIIAHRDDTGKGKSIFYNVTSDPLTGGLIRTEVVTVEYPIMIII